MGGAIAAGMGAGLSSGYLKEAHHITGLPTAFIAQVQRQGEDIAAIKAALEALQRLAQERLERVNHVDRRVDELRREFEQLRARSAGVGGR